MMYAINKGTVIQYLVILLSAGFFSVYITQFLTVEYALSAGITDLLLRSIPLFIPISLSFCLVFVKWKALSNALFKYRHVIGVCIFVFLVFFELNGSSVGVWTGYLPDAVNNGLLWGEPQSVRSDEWAITLPSVLAQDHSVYQAQSDIVRGAETDVTLMPSLPTFSLITIFKPQNWGFLLFGAGHGVAWSWAILPIALFLVTIDLFLILTKGSKWLSVCAAVILTFSPYATWWNCYGVLLYGQALVLALYWMLRSDKRWVRVLCGVLIPWLCGCYLFLAYPAWIVPCFFIFTIMGAWVAYEYRKDLKAVQNPATRKPELFTVVACLVLFAVSVVLIFFGAGQAIEGMSNTLYPGTRFYTGGDGVPNLFDWVYSIYFGIMPTEAVTPNPSARSAYFSLFPISFILALYVIIRKKNKLLIALCAIELLYICMMVLGLPDFVARFTMLSNVGSANRMLIATGFLDVVVLMVSLHEIINMRNSEAGAAGAPKVRFEWLRKNDAWMLIASSVCVGIIICAVCKVSMPAFWTKPNLLLLFIASASVSISLGAILTRYCQRAPKLLCISVFAIVFASGMCVNPVQRGIGVLTENPVYKGIESVAASDPDALWVSEGSWVYGNLCIAAGAPTLTSTNTYPNMDLWNQMDPDGDYEEVYKRYANIETTVSSELAGEEFELIQADLIRVNFTPESLKELGVKYLFALQEHKDTDEVTYNELFSYGNMIIYELQY